MGNTNKKYNKVDKNSDNLEIIRYDKSNWDEFKKIINVEENDGRYELYIKGKKIVFQQFEIKTEEYGNLDFNNKAIIIIINKILLINNKEIRKEYNRTSLKYIEDINPYRYDEFMQYVKTLEKKYL